MKVIGLTGGIASGKSTVAGFLAAMGVPVIDADDLSRAVVEPGRPAHGQVAARWPEVIRPDGTLDRARLGGIVFADQSQRRELTAIVLPRIVEELERRVRELDRQGHAFCVFEAATLFEEGLDERVAGVLVVSLPPEEQVRRLCAKTGLSEKEARARLAAQLPLEEKVRRARWIVENAATREELATAVTRIWERIRREA